MMKGSSLSKFIDFCWYGVGCICIFLYIYNISFSFLPGSFRSRMLIGGIGIFYYIVKNEFYFNKYIFNIILLQGLYIFCNVLSSALNSNFDYWFCQFAILNIIYLFGALWLCDIFKKQFNSFKKILYVIIGCVMVHNLLAFIAFMEPTFRELLVEIQNSEVSNLDKINTGVRAVGLGIGIYFFGGVISAFGEIATMYLISKRQINVLLGLVILIIILITGIFIARTSVVGLFVGALFFTSKLKDIVKIFIYLFISFFVIYLIYTYFLIDTVNVKWAFEFIQNYSATGSVGSYSTDHLISMYEIIPKGLTWIWGDGIYTNPDGSYYMHTDIGYMRVIFGIGILGLICEFINYYYVCKVIYLYSNCNKWVKSFGIVAVVLVYVLYIKGHTQLFFFLYLCLGTLYYTHYLSSCNKLK